MGQVDFPQMILIDSLSEAAGSEFEKSEGTLTTEGKNYQVVLIPDSEAVTEAVFKFLQEANKQEQPLEKLLEHAFTHITPEMVEVETELVFLLNALSKMEVIKQEPAPLKQASQQKQPAGETKPQEKTERPHIEGQKGETRPDQMSARERPAPTTPSRSEVVYTSLFSLARSFHTTLSANRQKKESTEAQGSQSQKTRHKEETRPAQLFSSVGKTETQTPQESRYDREGQEKEREREEGGSSQNQQQQQQEKEKAKKKKIFSISGLHAAQDISEGRSASEASQVQAANENKGGQPPQKPPQGPPPSADNIYIRFLALMARILGQAEMEAHQLYLRIKDRTDAIDVLTLFTSKVNAEKGAIDWTNNEEMKKLLEKVRALGVEIPEGKYKWSEDEKKLLKENVQMKKDSMEKITQLERTDMQRYLQEASQCHQARSNVLKLLKEVGDTIIHNMRGS